ncbi:MAG TPA: helix-turn-helix domain-containing protein [Myxococcaceae bacterium]|nr:helix-turn-helix domain-containing protein [Myxococcaceae bacterium]
MAKSYGQRCPIACTLDRIGERWTLLVVRDLLLHSPRRFQDLQASLKGIAPNLLTERLRQLEEAGIVERTQYSDRPPRFEYALTPRGAELAPALNALFAWGTRHLDVPVRRVHRGCGGEIAVVHFCEKCGEPVAYPDTERILRDGGAVIPNSFTGNLPEPARGPSPGRKRENVRSRRRPERR